jgi:formylglycine-generating enzyme required for sulfatase activity
MPFWLDQTEVTNEQYESCMADGECRDSAYANDARWNGSIRPVVGVSWNDAADYCAWAGGRLPTEAQWEYAARGPESLKYSVGNSAPSDTLLNYNNNIGRTTDVGSYPDGESWIGALDMAGNVWEWVADWYDSDYYIDSPEENPAGPSFRPIQGATWGQLVPQCEVRARRQPLQPHRDVPLHFYRVSLLSAPGLIFCFSVF